MVSRVLAGEAPQTREGDASVLSHLDQPGRKEMKHTVRRGRACTGWEFRLSGAKPMASLHGGVEEGG